MYSATTPLPCPSTNHLSCGSVRATSHYIYLANFALLFAMWEKGSKLSVKCQTPR